MIKVKLSKEVWEFIRMNSNAIRINGTVYFQPAPWWYTHAFMGENDIFEVHTQLPTEEDNDI